MVAKDPHVAAAQAWALYSNATLKWNVGIPEKPCLLYTAPASYAVWRRDPCHPAGHVTALYCQPVTAAPSCLSADDKRLRESCSVSPAYLTWCCFVGMTQRSWMGLVGTAQRAQLLPWPRLLAGPDLRSVGCCHRWQLRACLAGPSHLTPLSCLQQATQPTSEPGCDVLRWLLFASYSWLALAMASGTPIF